MTTTSGKKPSTSCWSSGRPLKRLAAELGITANSLRTWRDKALGAAPDPAAEIRRLQREIEYLRRQREILKKTMSILSEDPPSSMR
jgi:transposase-like protein